MRRIMLVVIVILVVLVPCRPAAQGQANTWRRFVAQVDVGTELTVRLVGGQKFRAVLVDRHEEAMLVQPKTRVPVAVQPIPYEAIASLERRTGEGMSAAQAAVIGVGSGVATVVAMWLILLAAFA